MRDNKVHSIRVRGDVPYDVRVKQRLLSRLWDPVGVFLAKLQLPEGTLQRSCNGRKGVFAIIDRRNKDYWELFSLVETAPCHFEVKGDPVQCAQWGITGDDMQQMIADVSK